MPRRSSTGRCGSRSPSWPTGSDGPLGRSRLPESEKGDRVAIWAPNSAEWIIAAFGLLTAGGVLVPVNTRFKADEAADIIRRSGAKVVLVAKGFPGTGIPPFPPVCLRST